MSIQEECPHCGCPSEGGCPDCLSDHAASPEDLIGFYDDPYELPLDEDWRVRGGKRLTTTWTDYHR